MVNLIISMLTFKINFFGFTKLMYNCLSKFHCNVVKLNLNNFEIKVWNFDIVILKILNKKSDVFVVPRFC